LSLPQRGVCADDALLPLLLRPLARQGLWELSFDKSLTQQRPFALEGGGGGGGGASSSSVDVPMMFRHFKPTDRTSSRERAVRFIDCAAYQAVRLPYKGCSISAVAVLPAAAAVAKHGSLAAAVADVEVAELLGGAKYRAVPPAGLELHMPKFTVKSECVSLKQVRVCVWCLVVVVVVVVVGRTVLPAAGWRARQSGSTRPPVCSACASLSLVAPPTAAAADGPEGGL
jgi:hypothetical protein